MIHYEITTVEDLPKAVKYAWTRYRNACIAERNSKLVSTVKSPIHWNQGECYECGAEVQPTDTGCWKCHMSFCE